MEKRNQKIIPTLWFDDQAEEAAAFYISLFENSGIVDKTYFLSEGVEIHGQPEGKVMTVDFELEKYQITALNGGPLFTFTPAISFFVVCEAEQEVDALWRELSQDGLVMMELGEYEWSKRYGFVQDRYGLCWQLYLGKQSEVGQKITPSLMFVGEQQGRAEEAIDLYTSAFPNSDVSGILRYDADDEDQEGTVKHAQFRLNGEVFMAMDSSIGHQFTFSEAISLLIQCEDQQEIDYFWETLGEEGDPNARQCGWLKDKFGVTWQVVPKILQEMIVDPDKERAGRVMKALLQMKKIEIRKLQSAYGLPVPSRKL